MNHGGTENMEGTGTSVHKVAKCKITTEPQRHREAVGKFKEQKDSCRERRAQLKKIRREFTRMGFCAAEPQRSE